jgi:hypothetical protein
MTRIRLRPQPVLAAAAAVVALVAAAAAALAPAAGAATAPPRLSGPPTLTYVIAHDTDSGRFVSIGATVHLDRRFAGTAEQHRYTVVAAPHLVRGQALPDRLFGGTVLGRYGARGGAWYFGEAVQLHQRRSVRAGDRWQVALARDDRLIGLVKTVTLRRA